MTTLPESHSKILMRIHKGKQAVINEKEDRIALQSLQIDGYIKLVEPPAKFRLTPKGTQVITDMVE